MPVLEELGGVGERGAVAADAVVEGPPSSLGLVDLVPDATRVEVRVLHHALGGRDELAHAALDRVGRLDERAERVGDHADRRQRVAVVALAHVQLPLQLVQLVLQLQRAKQGNRRRQT